MIQETENYNKSGYYLTLLFVFLFGALMTLLYLPQVKSFLPENENFPCMMLATLMFISSLLASSLNGIVLLPCVSLAFGAATALEAEKIRVLLKIGEIPWPEIILLLVLIPLHFLICSWGMGSSLAIRELMNKQQNLYRKKRLLTYTVMLVGTAAFAAVRSLIFI